MKATFDLAKQWSELLKNIAEIAALIIAGVWAYSKYKEIDAPSLQERSDVQVEVSWDTMPDSAFCLVDFRVRVRNISGSPFDIDSVRAMVALAETSKLNPARDTVVPAFGAPPRTLDSWVSKTISLVSRYGPAEERTEDYIYAVRRLPATRIIFDATLFWSSMDDEERGERYRMVSDEICGDLN